MLFHITILLLQTQAYHALPKNSSQRYFFFCNNLRLYKQANFHFGLCSETIPTRNSIPPSIEPSIWLMKNVSYVGLPVLLPLRFSLFEKDDTAVISLLDVGFNRVSKCRSECSTTNKKIHFLLNIFNPRGIPSLFRIFLHLTRCKIDGHE